MLSDQSTTQRLYKKLLTFYPRAFREQLGESMEQTFNDLCHERRRQTKRGWFSFVLWLFVETAIGIAQERILLIKRTSPMTTQKWGGLAFCLLVVSFIVASLIYLTGNLREAMGPLAYDLADFLYGPVWAASLVIGAFALRERLGEYAPRRMSLALLATALAAGAMVAVACIRSSNRHYHLLHPELNLETSMPVLVVWTTLVAGVSAAGWHFLGWALVLVGSGGWTSRRLPRVLSVLYLLAGASSLFVYRWPELEGNSMALGIMVSVWQGILLLRAEPGEGQAPEINASQPGRA